MLKIEGYRFNKQIYENLHFGIYSGIRNRDDLPVVAKYLKAQYPTPEELKQLEYEYNTCRNLDIPGVIKYYAVENVGYGKAIIMEDFDAISLARYFRSHKVDLRNTLRIVSLLVDIIAAIHSSNIIHKDINPYNILINPETKEVKIIDFSISTLVKKETENAIEPEKLKGTLSYISPEQTGRMNRSIDYRSDFYSLGVTFYEMLTGKRPFELDDSLELVHAHIARKALPPHEIDKSVPKVVSRIIMKLMSKNAEDRYQSAAGLKADIEECYLRLQSKGKIDAFTIGENDISNRFLVPEKLYGRKKETAAFFELLDLISAGKKALLLIPGAAGSGKSALCDEFHKPAAGEGAFVISGKYDRSPGNIPNNAIIRAFSALPAQLLTAKSNRLQQWKKEILKAVGNNCRIIIDALPKLELITGKQPPVPPLPPLETQNRLTTVFRDFIKVFAHREHPLILFLDDLHRADAMGLQLIDALLSDPELNYFLLVGAYRNEALDSSSPFSGFIEKWQTPGKDKKDSYIRRKIELPGLEEPAINKLLADILFCPLKKTKPLAHIVFSKTDGNPLFIHEFLKKLHVDGLIEFKNQQWTWDMPRIEQTAITDNVVELTTGKLERLRVNTLSALKIAACIGVEFPMHMAAQAAEIPFKKFFASLKYAIDEGILLKIGDHGKFSHNKVHEAIYAKISEKEKKELHLKIGRIIQKQEEEQHSRAYIFDLTNHFNKARDLLDEEEKVRLARGNLEAGQKAKAAAAYSAAYRFFQQGITLLTGLGQPAWEKDYRLALVLYTEAGEVGYLTGKNAQAEKYFAAVFENAKNILDKINVYEIKMHICMGQQKFPESTQFGREALKMLGLRMPKKASKSAILKEFAAVYTRIKIKGGASALSALPELNDPRELATARVLSACMEPAYVTDPDYFPLIVLKLINLTLKKGISKYAAFAFAVFGSVLCDLLGSIEQGYQLGSLGLEMVEKFDAYKLKPKTYYVYGAGINHWKNHMRGDLESFMKSYKSGVEIGIRSFTSHSLDNYLFRLFYLGESLSKVKNECGKYLPELIRFQQIGAVEVIELWCLMTHTLSGETGDNCLITGEIGPGIGFVSRWIKDNNMTRLGMYTIVRLYLLYLFGHFEEAAEVAKQGRKFVASIVGDIHTKEFNFYYSLALLAAFPLVNRKKQGKYLRRLKSNQKKMKNWSTHAPENFHNKYLLVEAGINSLRGKVGEAAALYHQAIELARENKFLHEEAAANECAAGFYRRRGIEDVASLYLKKAHYLYTLWGAKAKVKDLENKHPELVATASAAGEKPRSKGSASDSSTTASLDFDAILKASHAISGEIVMEKLLGKLIKIVMENAGAQRIILFLKKDAGLFIEAQGKSDEQEIEVLQSIPIEESPVPRSLIRYVERTRELVVLDDSSAESPFSADPYIHGQQPMSLLCLPVVHQDNLTAVLYLENKLSLKLFSLPRQETLKVLAAQAAVSLRHALIYENLTRAEEKVRTILETTKEGFLELDPGGKITAVNPEMCAIAGRTKEELLAGNFSQLLAPGNNESSSKQFILHDLKQSTTYRLTLRKPDNTPVYCLINATPLLENNIKKGSFAMITDLSEYEKKDEQLRQAQKMETVGTLAGGLAHDFNNILGGITGSLSLLQMEIKREEPDRPEIEKYLDDMVESAGRAKDIIKHLLALSRKDELIFETVDLNTTIRHVMNICSNTFDKSIELHFHFFEEAAPVLADSTQVEQVLLNLCVNAAHAMTIMKEEGRHWGGSLSVSVEKIYADRRFRQNHPAAEEIHYWRLVVRDDGVGIEPEAISKIFEPFYTTKVKSSGTGLGLSMVYNIVNQHKGFMDVNSEKRKGSTFFVYLPEYKEPPRPVKQEEDEEILLGEGLVLVVDDEPIMRKIAVKILKKAGYHVISAEDGVQGMELFKQHYRELRLVLLDMQMPKKSGRETYLEMKAINPEVKVLLASGFRRDERVEGILKLGVNDFIEKPYTFRQLTKAIHNIMVE